METKIQTITWSILDDLLVQARQVERRRAIRCLHAGDWEHAHRMLNALTVGTYVRPHRHLDKQNGEGFLLLCGMLVVLIFDEAGCVDFSRSQLLSSCSGNLGMDISPGVWHSLVALEDSVIYEVKGQPAGGYVPERDKDFAPWSPEESALEAADYVRALETQAQQVRRNQAETPC